MGRTKITTLTLDNEYVVFDLVSWSLLNVDETVGKYCILATLFPNTKATDLIDDDPDAPRTELIDWLDND